jgi:hypothetical protein
VARQHDHVFVLKGAVRPTSGLLEQWNRVGVAGVHLHIDQAANQFVESVVPHAAVAVGLHCLGPFRHQARGFVADHRIAGGTVKTSHSAEPLAKDHGAVFLAPAA